jgi:exonuclease III
MKPKLLSWTMRGLNEDKRLRARNLLRQWKADIIRLQDSRMELISSNVMRSLLGCEHVDWCYSASREASGGILLMWDRRIVENIKEYGGFFCCLFV